LWSPESYYSYEVARNDKLPVAVRFLPCFSSQFLPVLLLHEEVAAVVVLVVGAF